MHAAARVLQVFHESRRREIERHPVIERAARRGIERFAGGEVLDDERSFQAGGEHPLRNVRRRQSERRQRDRSGLQADLAEPGSLIVTPIREQHDRRFGLRPEDKAMPQHFRVHPAAGGETSTPLSRPIGTTCPAALGSTMLMPRLCGRSLGIFDLQHMRPADLFDAQRIGLPGIGGKFDPGAIQMGVRRRRAVTQRFRRQAGQFRQRGNACHPFPPLRIGGIDFPSRLPLAVRRRQPLHRIERPRVARAVRQSACREGAAW